MADQLTDLVKKMQAEGVPEAEILAFVDQFDNVTPSGQRPSGGASGSWRRPEQIGAEFDPNYMGADPDIGKRAMENLPGIGALLAGTAASVGSGGLLLPAVAAGGGAYLGARARGDSREDAAATGIGTGAMSLVVPSVVKGIARVGPGLTKMGRNVARSYLKPTLDAGRKEAARLFGRPVMAAQANEAIIERALQRKILGADNPEMALSHAIENTEKQLKGVVGDQPTRMNDMLSAVFRRGRNAARNAPKDVPNAQQAIEAEIERTRSGNLGGKLDFGSPRPPAPSDTLSAQPIVNTMRGRQPSAGTPRPQEPRMISDVQRIQNQQPRTQIMREAPEGSELGDLVARNFTEGVKAPTVPLIASHRPPPITATEAMEWARRASKDSSWDKPASDLVGWFNKAQESAARSAVKDAVPAARPLLNEMGDLLSLQRVIPQAMNREMNRNTVTRLPGMLAAVASGHPVKAAGSLLGVNLADQNAGKIAQTLYNTGTRIPGASPETADAIGRLVQAALLTIMSRGSHE